MFLHIKYIIMVGQILTPFTHPFYPIPVQSQVSILGSIYPISTPSPYHHNTIAQSIGQLPLGTISRPVAPGYDRHSLTGEEKNDSSHYLV